MQVVAVTAHKMLPLSLKTIVMNDLKRTLYSSENAEYLGITMGMDDYECIFEACVDESLPIPPKFANKKRFVAYCEDNSLGLQEAFEILTQHVAASTAFHNEQDDDELFTYYNVAAAEERMRQEATGSVASKEIHRVKKETDRLAHRPYTEHFYIAGGNALDGITRAFESSGRHKPIVSVQFADSLTQARGLDRPLKPGQVHQATILQLVPPQWIAAFLKSIPCSALKSAYLYYGELGKPRNEKHDAYIEACRAEARKLSYNINPEHVNSREQIEEIIAAHHGKRNAHFSVMHLIDHELASHMIHVAAAWNTLAIAPSETYAQHAPLAISMNKQLLADENVPYEQQSEWLYTRILKAPQLYTRCANEVLLKKLGYEKALSDLRLKSGQLLVK